MVSDRLYLSCWIEGFNESNMLRHLEKVLRLFPFSQLAKRGPVLRVYAVERIEPPQLEREFPMPVDAAAMTAAAREFAHEDSSIEVETSWDLWQFDQDWKLAPSAVTLICFGPEFETEIGDNFRIEFGTDARFLPMESVEGSLRMGQSNVRSLLHLVNEIEKILPLENRRLWSESGRNFAGVLAESLSGWEM
jgi:hypothetical protein